MVLLTKAVTTKISKKFSHIMGGGRNTKKTMEAVRADLAKELADNARDRLEKVIRHIRLCGGHPTDRASYPRISTSPTAQLTLKFFSTSLRQIGSSRRSSMISVPTVPK